VLDVREHVQDMDTRGNVSSRNKVLSRKGNDCKARNLTLGL
jgi:hypothetical protein